jgi:hypothetical protein
MDPLDGGAAVKFLGKLKQQLAYWRPLLRKLTQGEPSLEASWVAAVEAHALRDAAVHAHFARVLKLAFDLDVVSDEVWGRAGKLTHIMVGVLEALRGVTEGGGVRSWLIKTSKVALVVDTRPLTFNFTRSFSCRRRRVF